MIRTARRDCALMLLGIGMIGGSVAAWADPGDDDTTAPQAQLDAVQNDMTRSQTKAAALHRQGEAIASEIANLQEATVAAAKIAQQNEAALGAAQAQLKALREDTRAKLAIVQATHGREETLLAALQRVAIEPPAAMVFAPGSPLDSVRGAMLLSAIVPRLRAEATALDSELADLDRSRVATETQAAAVAEKLDDVTAQQEHLADLMTRKRLLEAVTRRAAAVEQRRLNALSAQAVDLKDLIRKLDAERQKRLADEQARQAALRRQQETADITRQKPAAATALALRTGDPTQARRLLAGDYRLVRPVAGRVVKRFGQTDGFVTAKGLTIATTPGAEVVAPYNGQILFAGPFRGYGQILIIEHPGGYDSLLAGCDHIDSVVGQSVVAGEPVGRMRLGAGNPSLYFEWRRKDQPIDPSPWLAAP